MRILFVAPRFHTNQIDIVKILKKNNHKVFYLTKNKSLIEDYTDLTPFIMPKSKISLILENILFFLKDKNFLYLASVVYFYKFINKNNIDTVVLRIHNRLNLYVLSIVLLFLKKKILYYDQGNLNLDFLNTKTFLNLLKKIEFYSRLFIFKACWYTPLNIDNSNDTNKLFYIPFAISLKNHKNIHSKTFNILSIGKFQKRKNHLLLLKSVKILSQNYNIKLTIIGECTNQEHEKNYKTLLKFIKEYKLSDSIDLFINIPHINIDNYYRKNNIFILPAYNEPASISILEAMSYGLPVICSDSCGTQSYINNQKSGLIFKTNNLVSLTESISYLLNTNNFYNFSTNSINDSRINTSPDLFYEKFLNMINKVFKTKEI